jgi:hypothetical protein
MFDDLYPEAADAALKARAERPPEPASSPRFSTWGLMVRAPAIGTVIGAAQGMASASDIGKAISDKVPANVSGPLGRIPVMNFIQSTMQVGADILNPKEGQFTSNVGTSLRNVAQDYTPDPRTTHVAELAVTNLFRMGSKALTAAAIGGNIPGAVAAGVEEGFSQADDLARQGVDIKTRQKVGAVTAATNAVGFALPAAGKNWAQTGALALAGGPVSFMAQNAATREILAGADYSKLSDQYDPFDPVGLALSTVLPLGFGALAMRGTKTPAKAPDMPKAAPPDDLVDAARVNLLRENMDTTNPVRGDIAQADAHVTAYTKAMDQQANGERVLVDVPEAMAVKVTEEMSARVVAMRAEVAAMADEIPPQFIPRNIPESPARAATETTANVQDPTTPTRAQTQAPTDQAGAPAAGNAATSADVSGAGTAPVQANGVKVSPLEARIAELEARMPQALDAVMPVEFDDSGKPTKSLSARDYLEQVKREAQAEEADAGLIEVAANCFLSSGS